jgi:hypothetical protein
MKESQTSTNVVHLDEYESGRYVSQGSVESFLPSPVNHGWRGTTRASTRSWRKPRRHSAS